MTKRQKGQRQPGGALRPGIGSEEEAALSSAPPRGSRQARDGLSPGLDAQRSQARMLTWSSLRKERHAGWRRGGAQGLGAERGRRDGRGPSAQAGYSPCRQGGTPTPPSGSGLWTAHAQGCGEGHPTHTDQRPPVWPGSRHPEGRGPLETKQRSRWESLGESRPGLHRPRQLPP